MLPSKKRLMIDLETTSLTVNAAVWQIGYFEIGGSFNGLVYLNPYDQNRDLSNTTIKWLETNTHDWNKMKSVFHTLMKTPKILKPFCDDLKKQNYDEIWAKGSDFDFAIFRNLLQQYDIELPWHYRKQCCMRSLLNVFNEFKIDFGDGSNHNALNDAEQQAECLIRILKHLKKY